MATRRTFLFSTVALLSGPAYSDALECAVFTKDRQAAIDPRGALQRLKDGNTRFVSGRSIHCDLMAPEPIAPHKTKTPTLPICGALDPPAHLSISPHGSRYS